MDNIYRHIVKYYETDQMGVAHHSNYVRWFEDARIDLLRRQGIDCQAMEDMGIIIPVTGYTCKNKSPARFGDELEIETTPKKFNGVRMEFSYTVHISATGEICACGETGHCFVDRSMTPLSLKRSFPDVYERLDKILNGNDKSSGKTAK
ncbi:MAG: acyl-CoA thioesterase [Oscillospiraceae bacterium]|nr:acyl-CoA thioesterase [Oscillospiraceae bacterium]